MLNARTREHISGLNNEALIEYVTVGLDLYEPEAVEFARGLTGEYEGEVQVVDL